MKKLSNILGLWLLMLGMVACESSDAPYNGYIETTQEGAATLVLKGYENPQSGFTVFEPEGFQTPFYIQDKAFYGKQYTFVKSSSTRLDEMKTRPADDAWQTEIPVIDGAAYWARTATLAADQYVKFRICGIDGNNVTIEYAVEQDVRPNANANVKDESGYSLNLEIPRLNEANVFVAHSLKVNGTEMLNYALEWDDTKKHSSWVAFSFDATTRVAGDGVGRKDKFIVDPLLPETMQVTDAHHKSDGFDRGHICGSADRLFTQEANDQTFYFSNMSPMIHSFNSPYWAEFEEQVRKWGGAERGVTTTYSKLYVVKGGALNELLVNYTGTKKGGDQIIPTTDENGFTIHGLACPKYYFMAVLSETDGVYHAIGFLAEHKEYSKAPTADEVKARAVSIDDLEEKTGIDFFCNLPDDLENTVESDMNLDDWAW